MLADQSAQSLFVSAVDSVVLRTIVRRFIEVYHANPFDCEYDSLLQNFGETFNTQSEDVGKLSQGKKARFPKSYRVKPGSETNLKKAFRDLGVKYRDRYGGDMHFSRIAEAVDYLEVQLTANYLAELLDITNAKRYKFRYEDLRPDALEDYYQHSLKTSIQLKIKNGQLTTEVLESKAARKELGAYFTPAEASAFTIELSMKKLLDKKSAEIEAMVKDKKWNQSTAEIIAYLNVKVLDPTVGGGSFLKQAFKEFTRADRASKLRNWIQDLPAKNLSELSNHFPWLTSSFSFHNFEEHIMKNCLYGVDIDFKGLTIGAYTLTLEALTYMEGAEKFPSLLNRTLKQGNAFVNWLEPGEWKKIDPNQVKNLLKLRIHASSAQPHVLAAILQEEFDLKNIILKPFKQKRAVDWGCEPEALNPFCWELEFPEAFYDINGIPHQNCGFSIVVGNPPWENLRGTEPEFFSSIDENWPKGKNKSEEQAARKKALLKKQDVKIQYDNYFRKNNLYNLFLEKSKQYRYLKPKYETGGPRGGNGSPNTYKLACERFLSLVNLTGTYAFIVPEGFAGDKGCRDLRQQFADCGITDILGFSKINRVFDDAVQTFAIVAGMTGIPCTDLKYTSNHDDIGNAKVNHENTNSIKLKLMHSLPIATKPYLALNSAPDKNLFLRLVECCSGGFKIKGYNELNTTSDMDLTEIGQETKGYGVAKGESSGRFQSPTFSSLEYGLNSVEYRKRHSNRAQYLQQDRLAWHDIAGTSDARRMVACIIPPKIACFNSLNVVNPNSFHAPIHFVAGILNSFCFEWLVRLLSKNNHINMFVVEGIPLPAYQKKNKNCDSIVKISNRLHGPISNSEKRIDLEAEMEATVACVYGLSEVDFEQLLTAFPKIKDSYKSLVLSAFRDLTSIDLVA